MRVLMTTDSIGGVWTFTRELAGALLARNCAVALVSVGPIPRGGQLDWVDAQVSRWGSKFRFAACDTPLEWMQNNERAYTEAEPLLRRVAQEFRADVLLSSQFCFGALKGDLPRIVVAHSDVLSWAAACRNKALPVSPWLERYRELAAEGLRRADAVVAPTQWMLDALAANFSLPEDRRVIANGRTLPAVHVGGARRLQAATAGRFWDEGKNLGLLAAVEAPMPILIAGESEHEGVRATGICGSAIRLGRLEEEELLALFRQSSIYICTSRYEPFGLAPLEAALCGCAVVANDLPSLREVWEDSALYFHDAGSLSALLADLNDDDFLLVRARARSHARALEFTAPRMASGYLDLLQGILQPFLAGSYVA
jgi:glycogen(starch) synthase